MIIIAKPSLQTSADWVFIKNEFVRNATKKTEALEIGASNPQKTKQLAWACKSVVGVEIFKNRIPKPMLNIRYKHGDWQKLTKVVPKNSVDIAVSSHVLEHVPDDVGAMNELYHVLKPGGMALISTPNRKRLTRSVIELFTGPKQFPYPKHEHVREYIESDILQLLHKTPFKKYKVHPIAFGLQGGSLYCYFTPVPRVLRPLANIWVIQVWKE